MAQGTRPADRGDRCLACGEPLTLLGEEQFRVGGTSGGWHLLLGNWADMAEDMLPFEILACPACRRVELRTPAQRRPGPG